MWPSQRHTVLKALSVAADHTLNTDHSLPQYPATLFLVTDAVQLTGPTCPSLFLNPFSPRPAKTVPFVSLSCLTLYDFTHQGRTSGWGRVNVPNTLSGLLP